MKKMINPGILEEILKKITENSKEAWKLLNAGSIIRILAEAGKKWSDPEDEFRKSATEKLMSSSGFSRQVIEEGLYTTFRQWTYENISNLHNELFLKPQAPGPKPQAYLMPQAPGPKPQASLTFCILGGKVFAPHAFSILHSLLAGSAVFIKTPSVEPLFASLFAESICRLNPLLGACIATVYFPSEQTELIDMLIERSDRIIVYGDNRTIESIRKKIKKGKSFVPMGDMFSFIVISEKALAGEKDLASKTAYDTAMYDQQGCMSPIAVFIEDSEKKNSLKFAESVYKELLKIEKNLPHGKINVENKALIRMLVQKIRYLKSSGSDIDIFQSLENLVPLVIHNLRDPVFLQERCRTLNIMPVKSLSEIKFYLNEKSGKIKSIGIAGNRKEIMSEIGLDDAENAPGICCPGEMQTPELRNQS